MVRIHGHRAEFRFSRPEAKHVDLIGDFNQWHEGQLKMIRDQKGFWKGSVRFPTGKFKFRYIADGQVFLDYAAFGLAPGLCGLDSVVLVGPANGPESRN